MDDSRRWRYLLPAPVRRLPADLAAVVGLLALTVVAIFTPGVRETPLRIVVGLPFVLFVPGYALVAALFPEATNPPADETDTETAREGIDGIERVALSFGLSIAVVPLLGLVLNFTPWGIRLVPIVVAVGGTTLLLVAIAAQRRWELPDDERFRVPYRRWVASAREELFEPETRVDAGLNVLLAASVVLAVASVGYAVAVPKQGESFTEFYLLTEEEDGDLVADDYPTEFVRGEGRELVVGVSNQEHEPTNYTVIVAIQRVSIADNTTTVTESVELDRFETRLAHNETWHRTHAVAPTLTGERLRLTYMLYRGSAPARPSVETAYRELHLWVNVTAPSG